MTSAEGNRGLKRFISRNGGATQAAQPGSADATDLRRRRDELARGFWEAQLDLGGLVYEMVRRDQFRMDVVVSRAAALQEIHAELGEIERLLHLEEAAAAGSCASCGALYAHGAAFCWQCGASLVARTDVEGGIVQQ